MALKTPCLKSDDLGCARIKDRIFYVWQAQPIVSVTFNLKQAIASVTFNRKQPMTSVTFNLKHPIAWVTFNMKQPLASVTYNPKRPIASVTFNPKQRIASVCPVYDVIYLSKKYSVMKLMTLKCSCIGMTKLILFTYCLLQRNSNILHYLHVTVVHGQEVNNLACMRVD